MNKKGMIGRMIGGVVAVAVGISLVPIISKQVTLAEVTLAAATYNATYINSSAPSTASTVSWGMTILNITPIFLILAVVGTGIAMAYTSLRDAGMIGEEKGLSISEEVFSSPTEMAKEVMKKHSSQTDKSYKPTHAKTDIENKGKFDNLE